MRIVFLGTGDFAAAALRALARSGHELWRAVSQPDRPAGRGRAVRPTPIHAAADELGVRHVQCQDVNAVPAAELLGDAEIGVVAAFGQKIGRNLLDALPRGCVNIHGSLLPQYRGAAPHQWAIINGETTTGVTVFQLDERWDAGPVWVQRETAIDEGETASELHDRLSEIGAELIVEALRVIESGAAQPRPQDDARRSFARKLTRSDAALDWRQPADRVVRRIHGLWSWPVATCVFSSHTEKTEQVQLARARVVDAEAPPGDDAPPGAFLADGSVQAGRGRVRLLEVKPAGGKRMSFEAFARGRRLRPPDRLLPLDGT